jgi:glutamate--cysteine ligase
VRDLAREAIAIARAGLARRAMRDGEGRDEGLFLTPIEEIVQSGRTTADELLARFEGPWGGSVDPVFQEFAF